MIFDLSSDSIMDRGGNYMLIQCRNLPYLHPFCNETVGREKNQLVVLKKV